MKKTLLYIHGRGGAASESGHYKALFPGYDVAGTDYKGETPWEAAGEIRSAAEKYGRVTIVANSIGAYYAMCAGIDGLVERAYFISPVADMEALILDMMAKSGVSEEELREKGEAGELSWDYLAWVRSHPIEWRAPTAILCAEGDGLVPTDITRAFAEKIGAELTIMPGGEHWFHTEAQMEFLDRWITGRFADTERLHIYPASRERMELIIASEKDEELRRAYAQMLDGCLRHPDQWDWYAIWLIELKDGTHIGDLSFKGLSDDGAAEIGYGIIEEYRAQGFASEAVSGMCRWAFRHPEVRSIEAETEAGNAASQRVLKKCGFRPNGIIGEEGPRFSLAPMEVKNNILTEETFIELYSSVGWEPPCEAQVRLALQNSLATFTALENGKPVGMVRMIGDGGMSFYIKDFAVHPDYQARGTGKMLLRALEQFIRDSIEPGWAVSLELISTKEAISFYRKMGFEERPCEWDGPGMMKMMR